MRMRCPAGVGRRYDSASFFRLAKFNARLQAFCRHLRIIVLQWVSMARRVAPMLHLDREVFLPGQPPVILEYSRCNRTVYVSAQPGNAGVAPVCSRATCHRRDVIAPLSILLSRADRNTMYTASSIRTQCQAGLAPALPLRGTGSRRAASTSAPMVWNPPLLLRGVGVNRKQARRTLRAASGHNVWAGLEPAPAAAERRGKQNCGLRMATPQTHRCPDVLFVPGLPGGAGRPRSASYRTDGERNWSAQHVPRI